MLLMPRPEPLPRRPRQCGCHCGITRSQLTHAFFARQRAWCAHAPGLGSTTPTHRFAQSVTSGPRNLTGPSSPVLRTPRSTPCIGAPEPDEPIAVRTIRQSHCPATRHTRHNRSFHCQGDVEVSTLLAQSVRGAGRPPSAPARFGIHHGPHTTETLGESVFRSPRGTEGLPIQAPAQPSP